MPRHRTLPDPFVAILRKFPGYDALMTNYTHCPSCEKCERSIVYLTPREQAGAARAGLPTYGTGAATRLNRAGCKCPFYAPETFQCTAYLDRPLICNLFPLDLLERERDGRHWWVLFGACDEVRLGRLKGKVPAFRRLARLIDRRMPLALKRALVADAAGAVPEPGFYRYPIHWLVPVSGVGDERSEK
ncbi:MAG: YkgJ family cysteine cluster protein [Gemmatimonadales bacterium]